jgi:hypothetical protein
MKSKNNPQFSVVSKNPALASKKRPVPCGLLRRLSIILASSFISLLPFSQPSFSQDVSFSAVVDRTDVGLDDQITLTISVSGQVKSIPQPELPSLDGFTVHSAGRSQNFTYSGGKIASSVTFNYILVPRKAGEFTIGSAQIVLDGKAYKTDPINVTVSAGEEPQSAPTPSEKKSVQKKAMEGKDLFIETTVDKKKAYVNQQITLTFRFYQGVRLFNNPEYVPPSLTGFWTEDLPPRKQYYKAVNGRQYFVQELKTALFPTAAGKHTIGEAELRCTVEDLDQFFKKDPFRMFDRDLMSLFRQGKPQVLKSKPIQIEVLPLPEMGKPEGFAGTVGSFSMKVGVDKKEVVVGEPITLKMKISGAGNVKSVGKPEVPELKDFRIYDSGSSENISKKNYLVQGVKSYEMVLIPKKTGNYNVPSLEFSFFEPKNKTYKVLKSNPILVTALPGAEVSPTQMAELSKQEIGYAVKDIRYIKLSASQLKNQGGYLYKNPLFLFFQLIPLLVFVVVWRYQKHQNKMNSDVAYARIRRAGKLARKRLKVAGKLISAEKSREFYSEVAKAMIGYVGDKLNLPAYGLTKDRIELELSCCGVEKEKIDNLLKLLDSCDYARFAPGSSEVGEMRRFLNSVEKAIVDLED